MKIIEFAKLFYESKDIIHNLSHIERVLKYVDKLTDIRLDLVDKEIVTYAAYFHGIIYSHENSIRSWLISQDISENCINKIVKVSWESQKNEAAETLEETIDYIENNILDKGVCYLSKEQEIYYEQQIFAKDFIVSLKEGLQIKIGLAKRLEKGY